MWPLKRRKTDGTTAYQEHLERLREWFGPHLSEEELLNPSKTADGHRLDAFFTCYECGTLVHGEKAKAVEHRYASLTWNSTKQIRHYCPAHAPDWDVVQQYLPGRGFVGARYYRRIPAVPEQLEELEEVVAAPKRPKTRRSKKGK